MTEPTQVDDHAEKAVTLLLSQFRDKRAFAALIRALTRPLNTVETDLFAIMAQRAIDDAEGDQLDGIGSTVGCLRASRTDADYRTAIRKEIDLHNSDGTRDTLIDLTDGDVDFVEEEAAFAEFQCFAGSLTAARAAEITRFINLGRGAGIYFTLEYTATAGTAFAFDGAATFDGPSVFTIGTTSATENATP